MNKFSDEEYRAVMAHPSVALHSKIIVSRMGAVQFCEAIEKFPLHAINGRGGWLRMNVEQRRVVAKNASIQNPGRALASNTVLCNLTEEHFVVAVSADVESALSSQVAVERMSSAQFSAALALAPDAALHSVAARERMSGWQARKCRTAEASKLTYVDEVARRKRIRRIFHIPARIVAFICLVVGTVLLAHVSYGAARILAFFEMLLCVGVAGNMWRRRCERCAPPRSQGEK